MGFFSLEAWAGDADAGPGHGHGHGHECAGDGQTDEYGHECPGYGDEYAGHPYGNEYQDPAYGDEYTGPGDSDCYAGAASAGWGVSGVPVCVGQITDAPMIVGVMLRRVKVYGEMKTGHPVGELAKGEQVEILRIYPPDACERFWGEIAGERFVVVDGARGRRVQLLIGVDGA